MIPAMTTGITSKVVQLAHALGLYFLNMGNRGNRLLTIISGLSTPEATMPTPDFAVPYAAPKQVKTMAAVHPIAPKKGA